MTAKKKSRARTSTKRTTAGSAQTEQASAVQPVGAARKDTAAAPQTEQASAVKPTR